LLTALGALAAHSFAHLWAMSKRTGRNSKHKPLNCLKKQRRTHLPT